LLCVIVAAVAGCSYGDDESSLGRGELSRMVLQPEDVARVFTRFDVGPQAFADAPTGSRSDPARFGRIAGWKARYRRRGTAETSGPLVIESRADVFDSSSGADDELDAARSDLTDEWKPIDDPGLGDESFAATSVQPGFARVRHFQVVWREDNATGSLSVNGFDGRLSLSDALELARKQQRRIADAAEG
jgi:hypothetical protein